MAIQVQGNGGTVAEVDGTLFRALRVTLRPADYGSFGSYRLSQLSGTMAVSLGAGAELYQFRWIDGSRLAVVHKVRISAGANVAASTAALVALEVVVARGWSGDGSGGTAATLTGNNQKLRTSMGSTLVVSARISTTAGLTAGTKTLDTQGIGNVAIGITTGAITTGMQSNLLTDMGLIIPDGGQDHPLVLAQNEGWVLRNGANAWPAGMTWNLAVTHGWSEVTSY